MINQEPDLSYIWDFYRKLEDHYYFYIQTPPDPKGLLIKNQAVTFLSSWLYNFIKKTDEPILRSWVANKWINKVRREEGSKVPGTISEV